MQNRVLGFITTKPLLKIHFSSSIFWIQRINTFNFGRLDSGIAKKFASIAFFLVRQFFFCVNIVLLVLFVVCFDFNPKICFDFNLKICFDFNLKICFVQKFVEAFRSCLPSRPRLLRRPHLLPKLFQRT